MTDYPQYIHAAIEKLHADNPGKSWGELLCLALTMTPPEPPKDVLVDALEATWSNADAESGEDR